MKKWWKWLTGRAINRPTLIIDVGKDDRAYVRCDWPDDLNAEQQTQMARVLAALINVLNAGNLRPLCLQAVVLAGRLKGQNELAAYILQAILAGMADGVGIRPDGEDWGDFGGQDDGEGGQGSPRGEPPVISPDRVFIMPPSED